jgi:hypothetical protein
MGRECLGAVHKIEGMLQILLGCKDTIAVVWEFCWRLTIVCMSRKKKSKTQTDPEVRSSYPLVDLSMAGPLVSTSSLMAGARVCMMGSCISRSTVGVLKSPFQLYLKQIPSCSIVQSRV